MPALEQKWRWLCVECDTEGMGYGPEVCPTCGCKDSWYKNNCYAGDPRSMRQILSDDILGNLKNKDKGQ